jgi:hypothetical protein
MKNYVLECAQELLRNGIVFVTEDNQTMFVNVCDALGVVVCGGAIESNGRYFYKEND